MTRWEQLRIVLKEIDRTIPLINNVSLKVLGLLSMAIVLLSMTIFSVYGIVGLIDDLF